MRNQASKVGENSLLAKIMRDNCPVSQAKSPANLKRRKGVY